MLLEHGFGVRQFAKTFDAVIRAHAGMADAAERRVVIDRMPAPVVDRDPAGMGTLKQHPARGRVMAEAVQRQRTLAGIDALDHLFHRIVGHHRQDRAEQFFLHDPHIGGAAGDDMQRHPAAVAAGVVIGAGNDRGALFARVRQQIADPREMPVVHDPAVVGAFIETGCKHPEKARFDLTDKILDALARHQRVVGRNANLSAIGGLAVRNAPGGIGHGKVAQHDRGRFAAELQRHRREVFCRRPHHDLADGG